MPDVTSGNINACVLMLAEKGIGYDPGKNNRCRPARRHKRRSHNRETSCKSIWIVWCVSDGPPSHGRGGAKLRGWWLTSEYEPVYETKPVRSRHPQLPRRRRSAATRRRGAIWRVARHTGAPWRQGDFSCVSGASAERHPESVLAITAGGHEGRGPIPGTAPITWRCPRSRRMRVIARFRRRSDQGRQCSSLRLAHAARPRSPTTPSSCWSRNGFTWPQ